MAQEEVQAGSETQAPTPESGESAPSQEVQQQAPAGSTDRVANTTESKVVDRDALALQLLDDGKPAIEARKALESATPAAKESGPGKDGSAKGEAKDDAAPEEKATARIAEYAGLDDRSRQQLSQTGLLPKNVAHWNALPEDVRQAQLEHARAILAEKSRLYQAQQALSRPRNPRGQFVAGQAADDQAAQGEGQADVLAQPQGVQGKDKPGATRKSIKERLQKFGDTFGDEAAQSIAEVLEEIQAERTTEQTARDEKLSQIEAMYNLNVEQGIKADEAKATAIISKDLPEYASNPELQAQVREEAKIRLQAAYNANVDTTWEQCLVYAARAILYPNIRQSEQARLAKSRQETLRNTPDRGNQQTSPNRTLSAEDKDQLAMNLLNQGKSAAEVRLALAAA